MAVGWPPFGGQDEQGPLVRTAEHQRERGAVLGQFDALQNFAAFGDAGHREPGANPDRAFGVEADAVRGETVGEDPPTRVPGVTDTPTAGSREDTHNSA